MHLSNIDKLPITTGGSPIQLHCKNFMCITFVIPKERDCHDIYTSLLELSKPGMIMYLTYLSYQIRWFLFCLRLSQIFTVKLSVFTAFLMEGQETQGVNLNRIFSLRTGTLIISKHSIGDRKKHSHNYTVCLIWNLSLYV
jgi:hypothetical protein